MAKRTIKLLGEPIQNEDDKAAEAITPGHLVAFNGSGDLIKHADTTAAAAGVKIQCAIALEREEMGQGIDTPYSIADKVKVGVMQPGCRFLGLIGVVTTTKGGLLESAGNGTLRNRTTGVAVARALEVVVNGAGTARVRCEAL